MGNTGRRAEIERLTWLPLLAAVCVVSFAPASDLLLSDSRWYLLQADAIAATEVPPGRYPPGFATVLAVGDALGVGVLGVLKLAAIALVVLVVLAARRIGGPIAGAVAGLLCCASPWMLASGQFLMSDPLAALVAVAGLLAVDGQRSGWSVVAVVAGVVVRLFSVVGIAALFVVNRRGALVAGVAAVVLVGSFQWATNGSPLETGYTQDSASWSAGFVFDGNRTGDGDWLVDGSAAKATTPTNGERDWPNAIAYPLVVLGISYVFMPPFLVLIGLSALWRRRSTEAARFAGAWLGGSLALALPYYFQTPRFLAPAMMMMLVFTAVGVADVARVLLAEVDGEHGEGLRRVGSDGERRGTALAVVEAQRHVAGEHVTSDHRVGRHATHRQFGTQE